MEGSLWTFGFGVPSRQNPSSGTVKSTLLGTSATSSPPLPWMLEHAYSCGALASASTMRSEAFGGDVRKIDPPGAPGRVFDLTCASCGHVRRCIPKSRVHPGPGSRMQPRRGYTPDPSMPGTRYGFRVRVDGRTAHRFGCSVVVRALVVLPVAPAEDLILLLHQTV